jgi:hypothetical protein
MVERRLGAVAFMLAWGACASAPPETILRVRNPMAVAVHAATPQGSITLLPAEAAGGVVDLPLTQPPFAPGKGQPIPGQVQRAPDGAILARCTGCGVAPEDFALLPGSGQFARPREPGLHVGERDTEIRGNDLLVHVQLRLKASDRTRFAQLDLVTPTANIAEFRRFRAGSSQSFNSLVGDLALIVAGAAVAVLGYHVASNAHSRGDTGVTVVGGVLCAAGVAIGAGGVYLLIPEPTIDEPIWPR